MPSSKFARPGQKKKRVFSKIPQFWSFSRWEVFRDCPYRYAMQFIARVKTPDETNYAFERGNAVHKLSENFISGEIRGVPKDLATFRQEFLAIRKLDAVAEVDYTVNADWEPTASDDFDNAWLRAKLDIVVPADTLTVIDVKTGQQRTEKHEEQGSIYGMLALERHADDYDAVDVEFWYTDSGETLPLTFELSELDKLKRDWLKKIKPMLNGRLFPKTPSKDACRYCKFRSDKVLANGDPGDCDEWRKVG